jgi:hypothetical protein
MWRVPFGLDEDALLKYLHSNFNHSFTTSYQLTATEFVKPACPQHAPLLNFMF